ncbi:methyl-accepting chemotaxis protein [Laspinema olomoucense]|uniref:Methyl-accepting chemotaxis protein n=1 Tax=Laspinema olomoucense D3b TaxID=2953688 RepID=A0ABT2N2Y9_9CYAN|nr:MULTISPECIES: methyl-accepting chemotaxis protein [unclassified Laspinema]MCT7974159.1 methyl-accepting chemotaxis protein [Laspinema sp. D3d]MCT7977050.1 methyl-accepting chemotaxis protein [Laspinema sp. D3b]MCT7993558.1 methyl-accepting chemotaxis protein [Laspinema sp. D3c]
MLFNLKLKARILLGYSLPLIFSISSAGLVFVSSQQVQKEVTNLEKGAAIVRESDRLALRVMSIQRSARGYIIDREEVIPNAIEADIQHLENSAEFLQIHVEEAAQQKKLEQILALSRRTIEFNKNLVNLVQQNRVPDAIKAYTSREREQLNRELETLLAEFNQREDELQKEKSDRTNHVLNLLSVLVLLSTAITAIVAWALGWAIASRITDTLSETTNTIASSSSEIAAMTEQQERVANQQASAVHETTSTMEQLGLSSQESSERAEATTVQVEQIANQILHLSEQVNQIDKIAGLVSDIANQTNMLALNAAVEAVRAGEQGKGFGVVASEIRKLADRSKQSAEKISDLVTDIERATNSAVMITKDGTRSVESVVSAVNHIAVNAQQISFSAKQQALAIQQTLEAMNSLTQSAQETASGIAQTKISIQQLNQVALKLQREI